VPTICLEASAPGFDGAILPPLQPLTLAHAVRADRRPASLAALLSWMFAFGDHRP